jgi:hypothetical protein
MKEPLRLPPILSSGTALFQVGGNIDGCSVGLRLFGEDLDPDTVSAVLGSSPDTACRKGDVTRGKVYDRVEPRGKWLLGVENQRGVQLEVLINQLLDRLTDDLTVWRELASRFQADLFCGLHLELWNRGLELSPRTLQRIAERGLKLGFDIYFVGDVESVSCDAPVHQ